MSDPIHKSPYKAADVRPDYAAGIWAYAMGSPASAHPEYWNAVAKAEAGKWNPWWIRTLSDVSAVMAGCYFDHAAGMRPVNFFPLFKHSKGKWARQPITLMDWQQYDIIMPVFGWKRPDGTRRYRTVYIEVPKKNGKSLLCSVLGLYLMVADNEPGAEVYVGAVDSIQAEIVHRQSRRMVKAAPSLRKILKTNDTIKRISYEKDDAWFQVLADNPEGQEGLNIHASILDELHVHKTRNLYDSISEGGAARSQPLLIMITTAGVYDPTTIGWEQHEHALEVQSGASDDWSFFAYVANAGEGNEDKWDDLDVWKRANPSWGEIINESNALDRIRSARNKPAEINNIKRYRLNIWTRQKELWMPPEEWAACAEPFTESDLEGLDCYCGLDLGQTDDMCAFNLWFPPEAPDGEHCILTYAFIPEDNLPKYDERNNGQYSVWRDAGWLEATPGNITDFEYIRDRLNKLSAKFNIRKIYYDPAFATNLATELMSDGFTMEKVRQTTFVMHEPTTRVRELVHGGKLFHRNNPVMNSQMANAQLFTDRNGLTKIVKAITIGKRKQQVLLKVDCPVACIMSAIGSMTTAPAESAGFAYL